LLWAQALHIEWTPLLTPRISLEVGSLDNVRRIARGWPAIYADVLKVQGSLSGLPDLQPYSLQVNNSIPHLRPQSGLTATHISPYSCGNARKLSNSAPFFVASSPQARLSYLQHSRHPPPGGLAPQWKQYLVSGGEMAKQDEDKIGRRGRKHLRECASGWESANGLQSSLQAEQKAKESRR
jgi:hypothetical protein